MARAGSTFRRIWHYISKILVILFAAWTEWRFFRLTVWRSLVWNSAPITWARSTCWKSGYNILNILTLFPSLRWTFAKKIIHFWMTRLLWAIFFQHSIKDSLNSIGFWFFNFFFRSFFINFTFHNVHKSLYLVKYFVEYLHRNFRI